MVSDIVLKYLRADNVFAETILRKCQKCSLLKSAAILVEVGSPSVQADYVSTAAL
jgi:hypothetical protein